VGNQPIQWDPSYALGIPIVDEQHQEFFRLANALLILSGGQNAEGHARDALEGLIDYACYHFHTEEEMLEERGYPAANLRTHKKEHESFREEVKQMRQRVYDGEEILSAVVTFATRWFLTHITRKDVEYVRLVKDAPPSDKGR
jgi:hemerythrin